MIAHTPTAFFLQAKHHLFESNGGGQDLLSSVVLWLGSYAELVSTKFVTLITVFSFVLY